MPQKELSKWWLMSERPHLSTFSACSLHGSCPRWHISFPISAGVVPQERWVTPFLPQPTVLVKYQCSSCPTGAVHLLSSLPSLMAPQQKQAASWKDFPLLNPWAQHRGKGGGKKKKPPFDQNLNCDLGNPSKADGVSLSTYHPQGNHICLLEERS